MEVFGQYRDDVEKLDDRAGPAVGEQQWERVGARRTRVDEVDRLTVDRRTRMLELVEPRLFRAPVVGITPVVDELAQVAVGNAVVPPGVGELVGDARARESRV